jgi:tripartite-type tricarboxylate transporter receptor subunit TctC
MNVMLRLFLLLAPFFPPLMTAAGAQEWPARPLRLVVPFPAGGSADVQSRVIGQELTKVLGQPVVVDNRPGAGGSIGAAEAAHAPPDGYTLFLATAGTHASNPALYQKLPYDPARDFSPLTLVTMNPQVIVSGVKYKDLAFPDLIGALKAARKAPNYGSSGIGSATHIAGELFNRVTDTNLVHVPYRGQGPALNDILSGELDIMFPLVADVFSFIESGKLHAFAVLNERRAKAAEKIPTTIELGYPSLALSPIWTALYTNSGVPKPALERLHRELVRIIAAPAFVQKFEATGYEIRTSSPEELAAFASEERARWAELIRSLNVRLE